MRQEVNLYQPIFRKQKRKFSAVAMMQAAALVIAGIFALYGYTYWQTRQLRGENTQIDRQLAALSRQLDETSRQFSERLKSKELQEQVTRLEKLLLEKQRLQDALRAGLSANTQGFSEYFVAFARQHIPGVWLTSFDITGAADQLSLAGRGTSPELVPRYLQRLAAEKRLSGVEFRTFQMNHPGETTPYVEFVVKTSGGAAPDAAGAGTP